MEVMAAARLLWARRRLLAVAGVVAIVIGVLAVDQVSPGLPPTLHSRQTSSGQAWAMVLVDTPRSQIADVAPPNFNPPQLTGQASLLADLLATAPVAEEIAARARIPGDQLLVTPPPSSLGTPLRPSALGLAGEHAAAATPAPFKLTVSLDQNLPIIGLSTVAPDAAAAQRLAASAIAVLRARLGAISTAQQVPAQKQLVVNAIQPPTATTVVHGARKLYGMAAAVVVFFLSCLAIVVGTRARQRRRADAADGGEALELDRRPPERVVEAESETLRAAFTGLGHGREPASVGRERDR